MGRPKIGLLFRVGRLVLLPQAVRKGRALQPELNVLANLIADGANVSEVLYASRLDALYCEAVLFSSHSRLRLRAVLVPLQIFPRASCDMTYVGSW